MKTKEELLQILFSLRKEASAKINLADKILNNNTKLANENIAIKRHLVTP